MNRSNTLRSGWRAYAATSRERRLASWISERGSLTRRLRGQCRRLGLVLLRQRLAVPLRDEAALLGLRGGRRAWVREVLLLADGTPVVFAHSVARAEAMRAAWRDIAHVGVRPVGDAIFERHGMVRGPIRARRVGGSDPLHRAAARALGEKSGSTGRLPVLWARRSSFDHGGHALWITEVFLPAILHLGAHRE